MRYRARVEYDGTEFAGFQVQPGRRTVQGEIERVLAHLDGGRRVRIDGAGTDGCRGACRGPGDRIHLGGATPGETARRGHRGAPAAGHRDRAARAGRTGLLATPRGVAAGRTATASGTARAARCASATPSGVRERLDVEAMQAAGDDARRAARLLGVRPWRRTTAIRTLHEVRVRRKGRLVTIDVVGDAFLRQMVRSIVAALLRVGQGTATAVRPGGRAPSPGSERSPGTWPRRTGCASRG